MHDLKTAELAAASGAVTRSTTRPALAWLQPVIHDWLVAVQARIGSHRQGGQPWWTSTHNLAKVWVASAKRIGWGADLLSTDDCTPAWDMHLEIPEGGRRFAVWAIGLKLSMTDNADALLAFEKGLGHARASATELPLEHDQERLVLAFVIPYLRAGDDQADDLARLVDTWLARFPFPGHLTDANADAFVLVRSDALRNVSGWIFPGVGVIAELVPS
jgi:hypothetical protein